MAIAEFDYRFKPRVPRQSETGRKDDEIEAAIDRVGRDRVFSEARRLGWVREAPPKWVWWAILSSLEQQGGVR